MQESPEVRDAVLDFSAGVTAKAVERFDDIVQWSLRRWSSALRGRVTERPRLRFGFEAEGLTIETGPRPAGYREGSMGWFVDEPCYGFPGAGGMRTRLTPVVRRRPDAGRSSTCTCPSGSQTRRSRSRRRAGASGTAELALPLRSLMREGELRNSLPHEPSFVARGSFTAAPMHSAARTRRAPALGMEAAPTMPCHRAARSTTEPSR